MSWLILPILAFVIGHVTSDQLYESHSTGLSKNPQLPAIKLPTPQYETLAVMIYMRYQRCSLGSLLCLATHRTDFRKSLKARTAKAKAIKRPLVLLF